MKYHIKLDVNGTHNVGLSSSILLES